MNNTKAASYLISMEIEWGTLVVFAFTNVTLIVHTYKFTYGCTCASYTVHTEVQCFQYTTLYMYSAVYMFSRQMVFM